MFQWHIASQTLFTEISFIKATYTFLIFLSLALSKSLPSNSFPFLWFSEYKYLVSLLLIPFHLFLLSLTLSLSSVDCFGCIFNLINNHTRGLFQKWKIDVEQENNNAVEYSWPSRLLGLMKLLGVDWDIFTNYCDVQPNLSILSWSFAHFELAAVFHHWQLVLIRTSRN